MRTWGRFCHGYSIGSPCTSVVGIESRCPSEGVRASDTDYTIHAWPTKNTIMSTELCGRCLDQNSRDFILQQIAELESLEVDNATRIEKDKIRIDLQGIMRDNAKFSNYSQLLLQRDRLEEQIEEINQHIRQLKQETTGIDQDSVREIWRKVGESERKVKEIEERIERLQKEIEIKEKQLENLRQEVEILASENQTTLMLSNQVKMARGLK